MSPNPANDFVVLRSASAPINSIVVHNLLGQEVLSLNGFDQQEFNLDISHLNSGVYMITINNLQTLKLVAE